MKFIRWQIFAAIALVASFSFAGREKIVIDSGNIAAKKGIVSAWATWIKDKGKKYDLNFHIRNDSEKYIIIKLSGLECARGGVTGALKYTFFNTGERTIDLSPGQDKGANMVCTLPGPTAGEFKISLHEIYDNPSADRSTPGKVIAKDIVWRQGGTEKSTGIANEVAEPQKASAPAAKAATPDKGETEQAD